MKIEVNKLYIAKAVDEDNIIIVTDIGEGILIRYKICRMVHYRYLHNGFQSHISSDIFHSVFEELNESNH